MIKKSFLFVIAQFFMLYCVNAEIIIHGQLSNAVKTAVKYAVSPSSEFEYKLATSTADGKYTISLSDSITSVYLKFKGVGCKTEELYLYTSTGSKYEINIALIPDYLRYATDSAFVIGGFNNFSSVDNYIPMKKVGEHRFSLTLDRTEQLKYQILVLRNVEDRGIMSKTLSVPGAEGYEIALNSEKINEHISYATPKDGKVTIEADLSNLFVDSATFANTSAKFTSNTASIKEIINYENALKKLNKKYWNALSIIFDNENYDAEDIRKENHKICKEISKLFAKSKSYEAKMHIAKSYIDYAGYGVFLSEKQIDNKIMSFLTSQIVKHPNDDGYISDYKLSHALFLESRGKGISYFDNPNFLILIAPENKRAGLIKYSIEMAVDRKDTVNAKKYYAYLKTNFPDKTELIDELQKYNIDGTTPRQIVVGNIIPDFNMPSLDNPNETFSIRDLRGKYVLIDLWGTWCIWCIREFPDLNAAYEKYKDKNFTILSIAFDTPAKVKQFRSAPNFEMPWLHSYEEKQSGGPIYKLLETGGVPHPILISPDGNILAIDAELRGKDLEKTLEKMLK